MGRRFSPADETVRAVSEIRAAPAGLRAPGRKRNLRAVRAVLFCSLVSAWFCVGPGGPAVAQRARATAPANSATQSGKMLVEADQLVYDKDKNTVSAVGHARLYYEGQVLEADRITYDRNTGRVYAEGHGKMTERDGTVLYGDRFDLTKDLANGFIESLRATSTQSTFLSAPRTELSGGNTEVFEKGTYTA
ncbi:MAG: LptA/OstA family protein, partial [Xanthobacteraceae bacterium]